jgi:nucleoid DNA-binding protein
MNEKISIQDLVVLLAEKADIPPKNAETLVKECFNIIQEALIKDKFLKIKNLGTFKLILVEDRESVDVSTGERVVIPAHYKVTFSPDVTLTEMVTAPYDSVEIDENKLLEEDKSEEIKTIYKETEYKIEQEEKSTYSERYDKDSKPVRTRNILLGIFSLIMFGFILFFAGYYFYPMIRSGKIEHSTPDSVAIHSYPVNHQPVSDSLKMKSSPVDSVTIRIADSAKVQTDDNQPTKTFVNKKHKILNGERINTIALQEYGHKAFWVYIYDENRDVIRNPDLINPGITINIPPAEKYGIDKNNPESVKKALELEQKYKL